MRNRTSFWLGGDGGCGLKLSIIYPYPWYLLKVFVEGEDLHGLLLNLFC